MAGVPFSPIEVPDAKIGEKRDLYDPDFMKAPDQRSFIAFASGLDLGDDEANEHAKFIS